MNIYITLSAFHTSHGPMMYKPEVRARLERDRHHATFLDNMFLRLFNDLRRIINDFTVDNRVRVNINRPTSI